MPRPDHPTTQRSFGIIQLLLILNRQYLLISKMRQLLSVFALFFVLLFASLQGQVNPNSHYVKPYTRSNGTYVPGHYRTNPNSTNTDNASTLGNTNPWTGKAGLIPPDNKPAPRYSQPNYGSQSSGQSSYSTNGYENRTYSSGGNRGHYDYQTGDAKILYTNGTEEFHVLASKRISFNRNKFYTSYDPSSGTLHETKGFAKGKLLDGHYTFRNENQDLRESGSFSKGLKNGIWTFYGENGKAHTKAIFDQGVIVGARQKLEDGGTIEVLGEPGALGSKVTIYNDLGKIEETERLPNGYTRIVSFDPLSGKRNIEYLVKDGILNGPFIAYWDDGLREKRKGQFLNGKRNGLQEEYDFDQNLISTKNYKDDLLNGPFKYFNPNGGIEESGQYKDNSLDGQITSFDSSGQISGLFMFKEGVLNGEARGFMNGILKSRRTFRQGIEHGRSEYYAGFVDTLLVMQYLTYDSGVLHGPAREVQGDSIIFSNYLKGKLDGDYRIYQSANTVYPGLTFDEQDILLIGHYFNGMRTQEWKYYSELGGLAKKGTYAMDKEHGVWRYYFPNAKNPQGDLYECSGKQTLERNFYHGLQNGKEERFYDIKLVGIECEEGILEKNSDVDSCFDFSVEKIHEVANYRNGELHGPYSLEDSNGNLSEKGEYENGLKNGLWNSYEYDRGRKVSSVESFYQNGKLNGSYSIWNSKNQLIQKGSFENGNPIGKWYYYNDDSKYASNVIMFDGDKVIAEHNSPLGKLGVRAWFELEYLVGYEDFDTLTSKSKKKIEITKFSNGIYWLDYRSHKQDTFRTSGYRLNSGNLEREKKWPIFDEKLERSFASGTKTIVRQGNYKMWLENGDVLCEGNYENNERNGVWKFYSKEIGFVNLVTFLKDELQSESYLVYGTNMPYSGTIKYVDFEGSNETAKVKNGLRHGISKWYDEEGKVTRKLKFKEGSLVE